MAFQNMIQELLGIPGMNRGLVASRINEAFTKIQNENVFSFQCQTGGWLTPGLLGGSNASFLSPGTITVSPFTNTITGDAVATAAWNSVTSFPLLTQQQIRIPYYSLYNIIAQGNNGTVAYATILTPGSGQTPGTYVVPVLDPSIGASGTVSITVNANGTVTIPPVVLTAGSNYATPYITFSHGGTPATFSVFLIATLTIDRPWMETSQKNSGYMIYQCYFPSPAGFKRMYQITDYTNNNPIDWSSYTQESLAQEDPQRTRFNQPEYAVPYGPDTRQGSSTYGQFLYELYPHPLGVLPYTFNCQCNWPALSLPTDTLPYPLNEELVKERARETIALFKESQKGDEMERGSGANWMFLVKAHHEEYKEILKQIRIMDRHLVDLYFTKAKMNQHYEGQSSSYTGNQANVGW